MRDPWETHPVVRYDNQRPRYRWRLEINQTDSGISGETFAKSKREATEVAKTVQAQYRAAQIRLHREKHTGELADKPQSIAEAHNAKRMPWAKTFRVWSSTETWEWKENEWRTVKAKA